MHNFSKLIDGGVPFEIVPNTRKITVPTKNRIIGTVGDCLSEQVRFACPMVIDGHDITLCGRKYVSWRNVLNEQGSDELKELDREDGYVLFCWNVPDGVTVGKGVVSFSIHFEDVDDNGKVTYRWGTSSCSDCEILDAVNTVVGTYKSMYVSGDTLVIADYTPVQERTLELNSESIVPSGTVEITSNGNHGVREYAEARVNINVSCDHDLTNLTPENVKKGVIINNVTGTFEGDHDLTNLKPENVKKGVTINNVTGAFGEFTNVPLVIKNQTDHEMNVRYTKFNGDGALAEFHKAVYKKNVYIDPILVAKGSLVSITWDEVLGANNDITFERVEKQGTSWGDVGGGINVARSAECFHLIQVFGNDYELHIKYFEY